MDTENYFKGIKGIQGISHALMIILQIFKTHINEIFVPAH